MRSPGSGTVPVWLVLPIMLLLGAGGYLVINHALSEDPASVASDRGSHEHSDGGAGTHSHDDTAAGRAGTTAENGHRDLDDHAAPATERPRAFVLGGFAVVNGAVLVGAAVLRHRGRRRRPSGARRS